MSSDQFIDQSPNRPTEIDESVTDTFRISPLIRITLLGLYVALTSPLPFLSKLTNAPVSPEVLIICLSVGFIGLYAVLSERVILDDRGIQVTYPGWVPRFLRQGWSLAWQDVKALKPRTTGQGGMVYYFVSQEGQGYLLPMRVVGFTRLVQTVAAKTGIDTKDVKPLAQPWMYLILLVLTILLLLTDSWAIASALNQL
jgi:hypothetical protein